MQRSHQPETSLCNPPAASYAPPKRVKTVRPPSYVSPQNYFISKRYCATQKCVYPRHLWQDIVREAGTQFIA